MEENLDKNNEVNKEISDNTTKSNSEEIKGPKSEKVINMDINNGDSATKVVIKNEKEINQRGLEINNINLTNTNRPIAGDKCWVINCEIKDTCNFWLSFEKDDISSLKSISLSKPNQKPSIIESFLIDEKRITLKLIISRVLQRLNGQKLIGVN